MYADAVLGKVGDVKCDVRALLEEIKIFEEVRTVTTRLPAFFITIRSIESSRAYRSRTGRAR